MENEGKTINSKGCPKGEARGTSQGIYHLSWVFHIRLLFFLDLKEINHYYPKYEGKVYKFSWKTAGKEWNSREEWKSRGEEWKSRGQEYKFLSMRLLFLSSRLSFFSSRVLFLSLRVSFFSCSLLREFIYLSFILRVRKVNFL